jgi:pimeloyl-ACP methyl ester carboxylesterase
MFLYLHGFASSPQSSKAVQFRRHFESLGLALTIPALDEGDFERLTIGRQRALVERTLAGQSQPNVIAGSSLGGYLAALHASAHPVDALILMAPAVDFASRLERRWGPSFLDWKRTGFAEVDHYGTGRKERLSFELVSEAAAHESRPRVSVPTLVLQGRHDDVVPLPVVEEWVSEQPQAELLIYDSGHELTDVIGQILEASESFLRRLSLLPE